MKQKLLYAIAWLKEYPKTKIMQSYQLEPIQTPRSNSVLKAPKGMEDSVKDLHITRANDGDGGRAVYSVWKVTSFWGRIRFFITGEVTFMAIGLTHPPISMLISDTTVFLVQQPEEEVASGM
jgi:hypothetical protein